MTRLLAAAALVLGVSAIGTPAMASTTCPVYSCCAAGESAVGGKDCLCFEEWINGKYYYVCPF